jgi:hypothetical protein
MPLWTICLLLTAPLATEQIPPPELPRSAVWSRTCAQRPKAPPRPAAPKPKKKLTLVDLPDNPLSGEVPLQLSADPVPRKPSTYYVVCIDGAIVARFNAAPASDWWDTTKHRDGLYTLTLERRDRASDKSFVAVTVEVEVVNSPP